MEDDQQNEQVGPPRKLATMNEPTLAVTAVSVANAQLMRDFTIPFAEDLLGEAEAAGWSKTISALEVGGRRVDLPIGHGPPIASLGHDVTVGFFAALGAGLFDAFVGDMYSQLLRKPVSKLWKRLRRKSGSQPLRVRIVTETWFAQDELLLRVEVVGLSSQDEPDLEGMFETAASAAKLFLKQERQSLAKNPDHENAWPRVVSVQIGPDGAVGQPEFGTPPKWMLTPPSEARPQRFPDATSRTEDKDHDG